MTDCQDKNAGSVDNNALATLGGRLRWVRENALGLLSLIRAETFLQALPDEERPNDTSQKTLGRYEKNQQSPRCDLISAYAKHSGVAIRWIFAGEGPRYAKLTPDPDDPFAGSLAAYVNLEIARIRESGIDPIFEPEVGIPAIYADALEHYWPIEQLQKLDGWRDQLLRRFEYFEYDEDNRRRWSKKGAGRVISGPLEEMLTAMVAGAAPEEVAKVKASRWSIDDAVSKDEKPPTEPSGEEVAETTVEEMDPPPEGEEKTDGGDNE